MMQTYLGVSDVIFTGHIPRSRVAEPCSSSIYHSLRSLTLFSTRLDRFASPSTMYKCPLSPYLCQHSLCFVFWIIAIPAGRRWSPTAVTLCVFPLRFPDDWLCRVPFRIPVLHLCYFFREICAQCLSSFLKWAACFGSRSSELLLCLEVNALSDACFFFSHYLDYFFILLIVPFVMQEHSKKTPKLKSLLFRNTIF